MKAAILTEQNAPLVVADIELPDLDVGQILVEVAYTGLLPDLFREDVSNLLAIADRLLLTYIRSQVILGMIVGTAVGIGLNRLLRRKS